MGTRITPICFGYIVFAFVFSAPSDLCSQLILYINRQSIINQIAPPGLINPQNKSPLPAPLSARDTVRRIIIGLLALSTTTTTTTAAGLLLLFPLEWLRRLCGPRFDGLQNLLDAYFGVRVW